MDIKYKNYINNLSSNIGTNSKAFWNFLKSKTKSKTSPSFLVENGEEYSDPVIKANILNRFFYSIFSKDPIDKLPSIKTTIDPNLSDIL